jgi:prepilin-type N-terminal cleavage/methylation domain-containing protein
MSKPGNKSSGFTLTETLVVIAIGSFLMVAIAQAIVFFYDTNEYAVKQSAAIRNAKQGVDSLVRDIREAMFADTGAYPVASMATTSLTIFADVKNDKRVEKVRYFLAESDLIRAVTAPTGTPPTYAGSKSTSTVASGVRNLQLDTPIFTYFDTDGNQIASSGNRKDLSFAEIQLVVNIDPDRQPDNAVIKSSATLRNVNKPS